MFFSQLILIYIKRGHFFVAQLFLGHPVRSVVFNGNIGNVNTIKKTYKHDNSKCCIKLITFLGLGLVIQCNNVNVNRVYYNQVCKRFQRRRERFHRCLWQRLHSCSGMDGTVLSWSRSLSSRYSQSSICYNG